MNRNFVGSILYADCSFCPDWLTNMAATANSFDKAVSQQTIFWKSTNQKQEMSVATMFVNG
jgi:alkyl hydroperoxide reductase subunit AhpF